MEAELPESGRRGSVRVWISVLLAASCLAVYGRLGGYPFIAMDDMEYVAGNPHVREGATLQGVAWAATAFRAANWHPLTWLSHMLDVELFGMSAGAHHLVNVAFHGANGVLLFLLLSRLTGFMGRSAIVAGLFLLHPLHVESVAWISERKDVLSGLFFLLTLWAYSGYVERRTRGRYFAVVLWFALGLLSKPMVVTLPFALLLLDRWPLDRTEPWRSLASEKVPLFLMSAASCAVTYFSAAGGSAVSGLDLIPISMRAGNALVSYIAYLGKTIWPSGLAFFYPHPGEGLGWWKPAVCAVFLLAATGVSVWQRQRRPYLLWGWLWYLGMLVPVIGLVQVGGQGMADRYTYLPLIGPFVAAVWGVAEAAGEDRRRKAALAAAGIAVLALLSLASWRQVGYWRTTRTLYAHALASTTGNWVMEDCMGAVAMDEGNLEEASERFWRSIRIKPNYPPALRNLGALFGRQGRYEEAKFYLAAALQLDLKNPQVHNRLGMVLLGEGKPEEAIPRFREAIRLRPEYEEAHYGLGLALWRGGDVGGAAVEFRRALDFSPEYPEAHNNLGAILAGEGKTEDAIVHFQSALREWPSYGAAHFNLGRAFAEEGRPDEAIRHLREAVRLMPGNRAAVEQLDAVLQRDRR